MKKRAYRIKGLTPCIMHNGRTADPLDPMAKQLKKVTGKRNKTEADHEKMAHIEFLSGLYLVNGKDPCWTSECIESMLIAAAKKHKKGPMAKIGILVDGSFPLVYDGPKDPEKLWHSGKFTDRRAVNVGRSKVMRTRPIFRDWELVFDVNYDEDILDEETLDLIVKTAGEQIGLSTYRPKYGRFEILSAT